MSVRNLVLQHLAAGMNQQEAARAVGVTPGLVSQLLANADFKAEVAMAKEAKLGAGTGTGTRDIVFSEGGTQATELDGTYDSLEMAVLGKLGNMINKDNYPWRPAELAGIVKTLNSAKRRAGPLSSVSTPQNPVNITNTVVQLNLPAAMQKTYLQPEFVVDEGRNQIVEVNGRRLDTLNSRLLLNAGSAEQRRAKLLAATMAYDSNQETPLISDDRKQHEDSNYTSATTSHAPAQADDAFAAPASGEPNRPLPTKLCGYTADDF